MSPDPREADYRRFLDKAIDTFNKRVKNCECPEDFGAHFDLLSLLGEGGFGRVYKARWTTRENLEVAMKWQLKTFLVKMNVVQNVIREKRYQWAMQSPFILPLLAAFKGPVHVFMIFEFAPLGHLYDYIDGRLPQEHLRLIAGMIVLGLEYLHACNILYRDLKPENVLLYSDGYIKLADFGLAIIAEEFITGACGTKPYMAPEMFNAQYVIDGVDWWAFGIMLYEMYGNHWALGNLPHGDQEAIGVIQKAPLQLDRDRVPDVVCDMVEELLIREVPKRLGSKDNGSDDVKNHAYFKGLNFYDLYEKKIVIDMGGIKVTEFKELELEQYPVLDDVLDENTYEREFKDF